MRKIIQSNKIILFSFFLSIIFIGTILLYMPICWNGVGNLRFIDALFTATSAVCVTGLITVDTSSYSNLGRVIIILLIQTGGFGIISFAAIYLTRPSQKISLSRYRVIKSYYIDSVESEPFIIIKRILLLTLIIEGIGTFFLFQSFSKTIEKQSLFYSLFHAVSAFCNAGFSLFSDNLENYRQNVNVNLTISGLIISGGIGFVVVQNIVSGIVHPLKRKIILHTKIVLLMTVCLIFLAALFYFIFEYRNVYIGQSIGHKLLSALFQAVTPRTAGFNTIKQSSLTVPSQILTLLLMFIGGASGSIAGGIKVTTFYIVLMMALRGVDDKEGLTVFKRRISTQTIFRAVMFMMKALLILFLSIFLLTITELFLFSDPQNNFFAVVFECFSAFGTVGLSLGITPGLSIPGKLIIIVTMFAGRVGMLALAIPRSRKYPVHLLDYPEGEVMIG